MINKKRSEIEIKQTKIKATHDEWLEYFRNHPTDRMISAHDILEEEDEETIESLKIDLTESTILVSDRIDYSLEAWIPEYVGTSIENVNEEFLRFLFKTKLSKEEIIRKLNKYGNKICFWTPAQNSRANTPVRAVRFFYYDDGFFHFNGYGNPDSDNGRSRGVKRK